MPDPTAPERCRCHSREGLEPDQHENDCPLVSAPERSDVQRALDTLDELLNASEPLSAEDLDAIATWSDNVILDLMRHQRLRGGRYA